MSRSPFIAINARELLTQHGLDNFDALWVLPLQPVDEPNVNRGGWSEVYRLELADESGENHAFYVKRQENHLTRTLSRPLGEPTFAREFRAIQTYMRLGVPVLEPVFFAQRREPGSARAIIITRALDGYNSLDEWLQRWLELSRVERNQLIFTTAALVRTLHDCGYVHNCLYPKHIFLEGGPKGRSRLIDLEKTRRALLGKRDYIRDLETLQRRSHSPSRSDRLRFLLHYLGVKRVNNEARQWISAVLERQQIKESS